ncbi:MAG: pilus assembly protein PilP [Deltaproteobacteria bacterium]|jgi:type IV pilus assembly protein PilP|nr:pilus assembly protein PilP [Deltaproteobacteria bacterium]
MRFKVEYNSPNPNGAGSPGSAQVSRLAAPPTAPNVAFAPTASNAAAQATAESPLPPAPPKLGAPIEEAPEPQAPLTPEQIEANKAKEKILSELKAWQETVNKEYVFKAASTADPFMPIESVAKPPDPKQNAPDDRTPKPVIQQLSLNQFTLTAIVVGSDPENNWALMDSGGKGYIVRKGVLIGNNNGFVKEITPSKLIVEEPAISYRSSSSSGASSRITEFRLNVQRDADGEMVLSE